MTVKYHINDEGVAGICRAVHQCRFKLSEAEHYNTAAEAQKAYEQKQEKELLNSVEKTDDLSLSQLNKFAKLSSDQKILLQGAETKSKRIQSSLLKNPNTGAEVLETLYNQTEEGTLDRKNILKHKNFPVEKMTAEDFETVAKSYGRYDWEERNRLLSDDAVSDIHKPYLQTLSAEHLVEVLKNKNNKLSEETRQELLNRDDKTAQSALKAELMPASKIRELSTRELSEFTYVKGSRTDNQEYLTEMTNGIVERKDASDYERRIALGSLSSNNNLPTESIKRIAESTDEYDLNLYNNKNIDDKTKRLLAERNSYVAAEERVAGIAEKVGGRDRLRELIVKEGNRDTKIGNAYHATQITFDTEEVKKLGMTDDDIRVFANSRGYNAGVSYDSTTGVFIGKTDSSG